MVILIQTDTMLIKTIYRNRSYALETSKKIVTLIEDTPTSDLWS